MVKKYELSGASLILTKDCNLRCKYCFEKDKHEACNVMTPQVARDAIDFMIKGAKANGESSILVTCFGGEPLLNMEVIKDSFDYGIKRTREEGLGMNFNIITNCTIFTDEYADFIRHWKKTQGKVAIQLSIDGLPEVQDMYRVDRAGNGSSSLVEKTLLKYMEIAKELDLKLGDDIHVHGVVNKHSLPKLYESYMYIRDKGFPGVWFMPLHEEDWDDNDTELFRSELTKISEVIIEDCTKSNDLLAYKTYSSLSKCNAAFPEAPCSAGKRFGTITPTGDIYPCHAFYFNDPDTVVGNIYTGMDDDKRRMFNEYGFENVFGDKPCVECGNQNCYVCVAMNYVSNGNMLVGFPKYCELARAENEVRYEMASKLTDLGLLKVNPFKTNCQTGACQTNQSNDQIIEGITKTLTILDSQLDAIYDQQKANDAQLKLINEKLDSTFDVISQLSLIVIKLGQEILKQGDKVD